MTIFASIFGFLRLHSGPRFLDQYIFRALVSQHPTSHLGVVNAGVAVSGTWLAHP